MPSRLPTTRKDFIAYCLRQLGAPVKRINVAPEQIEDRIDDALALFYEKHMDGTEERYVIVQVTDQMVTDGAISLDESIWAVGDARKGNNGNSIVDILNNVTYQIELSDYLSTATGTFAQNFDIQNYFFTMYQINTMNWLLQPLHPFSFNLRSRHLIMDGIDLQECKDNGIPILLRVYKKYLTDGQENGSDTSNVWNDIWLKKYATALIKRQWGYNLKFFKGVPLPGGIVVDGQSMYDEAVREIQELEEELNGSWQLPVDFFMM